MQTGGIGFMTLITTFSIFLNRKIGLHERQLLAQSIGFFQLGGVVSLIKRIVIVSMIIETTGMILLAFRFCPQMGIGQGLWDAVFHSVSAFCSAGFSLMGQYNFSSLMNYATDITVNFTIILLIVTGGIGFVVLDDIIIHKFRFRRYTLHSKLVLSVSAILILIG